MRNKIRKMNHLGANIHISMMGNFQVINFIQFFTL